MGGAGPQPAGQPLFSQVANPTKTKPKSGLCCHGDEPPEIERATLIGHQLASLGGAGSKAITTALSQKHRVVITNITKPRLQAPLARISSFPIASVIDAGCHHRPLWVLSLHAPVPRRLLFFLPLHLPALQGRASRIGRAFFSSFTPEANNKHNKEAGFAPS